MFKIPNDSSSERTSISRDLSDLTQSASSMPGNPKYKPTATAPNTAPIPTEIQFARPSDEKNMPSARASHAIYSTMRAPSPAITEKMHYEKVTQHITPREVAFIKELAKIRRIGNWIDKAKKTANPLPAMDRQAYFSLLQDTREEVTDNLNQDHYADLFSEDLIQDMVDDVIAKLLPD